MRRLRDSFSFLFCVAFQSTHPVWGATGTTCKPVMTNDNFNPRTPCGVRPKEGPGGPSFILFQSTHPVWGATTRCARICASRPNFNPRTPCGVRHILPSFHPLPWLFQSTHPVWGATIGTWFQINTIHISIHAPRVGCDHRRRGTAASAPYFNPRTPCGVRQGYAQVVRYRYQFQSTHPVWGATRSAALPMSD